MKVTVQFHELYGYSLTVLDIDPAYTLGDMARRRREILMQLEEEGVLTLNKELEMPVSSSTYSGHFLCHRSRIRRFLSSVAAQFWRILFLYRTVSGVDAGQSGGRVRIGCIGSHQ